MDEETQDLIREVVSEHPDLAALRREIALLRAVAEAAVLFRRSPIGSGREEIMERKERLQALDAALKAAKDGGAL